MATLRDIRRKIGAVKKTQQITKAMNMVAAAKLRGAQQRMEGFRPYAQAFAMMLGNMAGRVEPEIHPFFQKTEPVTRVGLVLMTADRGLCGSFNVNLINTAVKFIREKEAAGIDVSLICVGRKGRDFFRRRKREMRAQYVDVWNKFDFSNAVVVAREMMSIFLTGEVQEVYLIYANFVNMAVQRPRLVQLLPIQPGEAAAEAPSMEYLFEPPMEQFLEYLLPKYINVLVYHGFLENSASEHAARMTAMDNAQSNCKEMITQLTLVMNKARQAAITKELMDIVGGAEALKG
ncbi:MAG: ATP synthase F1 subunit gamma [Deltaproteobacteria bacterium]|nr:ATP synthase F1 subunit gamma [Deltaproteobacteria bacterium]MBI4796349.1 ATP synthase F1 subunit gamma [Deltaproteobacteria bacterium]